MYFINHSDVIVCSFMGNPIGLKRANNMFRACFGREIKKKIKYTLLSGGLFTHEISCSVELSMKKFSNLAARLVFLRSFNRRLRN